MKNKAKKPAKGILTTDGLINFRIKKQIIEKINPLIKKTIKLLSEKYGTIAKK